MDIKICVGSSCYLKGAGKIAQTCEEHIKENGLESEISLSGSFCAGKCNREGVTVTVDGKVFLGITPETFDNFFTENILKQIKG